MEHREGIIKTKDGIDLFYQSWYPEGTPKGIIQLIHGFAEHGSRYMNVVNALVPKGLIVFADDHRAHGRSGGERGHINSFYDFISDEKEFTKHIRTQEKDLPLFLLGHSMGSLISLIYLSHFPDEFSGLILSGTGIVAGKGKQAFQILMVNILSRVLPKRKIKNTISEDISRDPQVVEAYKNDPLVLKEFSFKFGGEMLKAFKQLPKETVKITLPVLIQVGEKDPIAKGAENLYSLLNSSDKTLKIYDDLFHEVYNELEEDRRKVLSDLEHWLMNHL